MERKREEILSQRLVQANVPDAVREMIQEIREKRFYGILSIAFEAGNLVNISRKENISVETFLRQYTPAEKKTIVIRNQSG